MCEPIRNYGGQRQCGYCQLMMGNGPIVIGRVDDPVDDPNHSARESRLGVQGNDPGAVAPIWVELDQH